MTQRLPTVEDAVRALRAHRRGVLFIAEAAVPVRFVADPRTGRLVLPLPASLLKAGGDEPLTLMTPEESDEALQLLVDAAEMGPGREDASDRWLAYHGTPRVSRWVELGIDQAKFGGEVFDGEPFVAPNALRTAEPRLCKRLNADRAALAEVCGRHAGVRPAEPVAVGVDPHGFDVRARFDIVRIEFSTPAADADAAAAEIDRLLTEGR